MLHKTRKAGGLVSANINNEKYYKMALNKVRVLMKLKPSKESEEGQELEMLITLIEAYEDVHVLMGV
jgi:HTH-type transcriptional regulator / antitoxin HigA